jgi:hypothetical protein
MTFLEATCTIFGMPSLEGIPFVSSFLNGISNIVGAGSDKKMFRIHASSDIAFVKNHLALGNWPHDVFPGETMSPNESESRTQPEHSISFLSTGLPEPAIRSGIVSLDFRPESFYVRAHVWTKTRGFFI